MKPAMASLFRPLPSCRRPLLATTRAVWRRGFSSESSPAGTTTHGRPFRTAVIGSGPAGFYTTYRVMKQIKNCKVDMYEALPTPYGLVRYGVAPDHPEVRNVRETFDKVASSPDFTFIGNVSVGRPAKLPGGSSMELRTLLQLGYDAVVFAYGAPMDRELRVPGEDLQGVYSARDFVGWYNGHPEHAGLAPDLSRERALVVGNGNVALDIARVLLTGVDVLRRTDMADHALEALSQSKVKEVTIVGRRGPMQASFTIKELRELLNLPDVEIKPFERALIPSDDDLKKLPRPQKRLMELLLRGTTEHQEQHQEPKQKSLKLKFLRTPVGFDAGMADRTRLVSTTLRVGELSDPFDPHASVTYPSNKVEVQPVDMVVRSIGYQTYPLDGLLELGVKFADGRMPNDGCGRVLQNTKKAVATGHAGHFPGLYCAGWVKRGATGVIASTMEDAFATADAIAEDWHASRPFLPGAGSRKVLFPSVLGRLGGLPGVSEAARPVTWEDWRRIDDAERKKGEPEGRERVKLTRTEDMLALVGKSDGEEGAEELEGEKGEPEEEAETVSFYRMRTLVQLARHSDGELAEAKQKVEHPEFKSGNSGGGKERHKGKWD